MQFTLLTDGSSDIVLLPILSWLLGQHTKQSFAPQWADLRNLRVPPKTLSDKIRTALEIYPCHLLFVHRDAENEAPDVRVHEINRALDGLEHPPVVRVIPVRMQEAWLLFDAVALRRAAGCPNGKMDLDLPSIDRLEGLNTKKVLHDCLRRASGLVGRRAKDFRPHVNAHRLAEILDDFGPLRALPAFRMLELEVIVALTALNLPELS